MTSITCKKWQITQFLLYYPELDIDYCFASEETDVTALSLALINEVPYQILKQIFERKIIYLIDSELEIIQTYLLKYITLNSWDFVRLLLAQPNINIDGFYTQKTDPRKLTTVLTLAIENNAPEEILTRMIITKKAFCDEEWKLLNDPLRDRKFRNLYKDQFGIIDLFRHEKENVPQISYNNNNLYQESKKIPPRIGVSLEQAAKSNNLSLLKFR